MTGAAIFLWLWSAILTMKDPEFFPNGYAGESRSILALFTSFLIGIGGFVVEVAANWLVRP